MEIDHNYTVMLEWTGNRGTGTSSYTDYSRNHIIRSKDKPDIAGSSDPAFRGDPAMYNPEELLLASLAACHMLWFLHLCADNNVVVLSYTDQPTGIMKENRDGGKFESVILRPVVTVKHKESLNLLDELHTRAKQKCFIANSVNFPVTHQPSGSVHVNKPEKPQQFG